MSQVISSKKDKTLVASIDFGTTFSGYAFSFKHDFNENPRAVKVNQSGWNAESRGLISLKAPTVVLFNPKKEFDSFGYEAENNYAKLAEDENHKGWYFFKTFKMRLHDRKITRDIEIEDLNKQKMKAKTVFAAVIKYLKGHLLQLLKRRGTEVDDSIIHWVLTVPAIWSDSAKQFMREAACEAGIDGSLLSIALEPEAASLFCQTPPAADSSVSGEIVRFAMICPGTKYMVIDLGGGTADITVHQKLTDGGLKEIHKASGGAWGGTRVDEEFRQMLLKIVGGPVLNKFKEEAMADYIDLERELETIKRTIKPSSKGTITMKIPVILSEIYEEEMGEKVKEAIDQSPFKGKITWRADKMKIDVDIFKGFFHACSDKLVSHIKELMKHPEVKDVNIFLMVGGFSESEMMINAIETNFPNVKVVVPEDAGLTVVKGAVIFGHMPTKIAARVSKYTYGINISPPFDPDKHPEDHRVTVGGIDRCRDVFKIYIQEGENIITHSDCKRKHVSLKPHQREMMLKVFATKKHDPQFVDEEGVEYIGPVILNLPDCAEKIKVEVNMKFGETELMVEAEEQSSDPSNREKVTAYFDFI